MPRFKVIVHRRIYKFLKELKDEKLKNKLKEAISVPEDYPLVLRRLDIEKLEGLETNTPTIGVDLRPRFLILVWHFNHK